MMSALGMMLLLLHLLPLVAFDGDGPTIRGRRNARFLKRMTTRTCNPETPCSSNKWCCDECCERSDCGCKWEGGSTIKIYVCDC
uniref:Conotoxin n=1 Tax=Conus betulinus TaxID=89764 RepID=A0A142C1H9_CONBE|nr:conotoxin [Conus betulinus]